MSQFEHPLDVESALNPVIGGFLATPTPPLKRDALNETASQILRLRYLVRQHFDKIHPEARLQVVTGYDATPAQSDEIQRWVRSWLLHTADFCVVLLTNPSTGCGCVRTWAEEFGIPLVVFAPSATYPSPLACGNSLIAFDDDGDLAAKLEDWLIANTTLITAGNVRRCAPFPTSEPERLRQIDVWRKMSDTERSSAADEMKLERAAVRDLLRDPVGFASAPWRVRVAMERQLAGSDVVHPIRDPQVLEAFYLAIDEYRWNPSEAAYTFDAGLAYEARRTATSDGVLSFSRDPALTLRTSWKGLHNRICQTRTHSSS